MAKTRRAREEWARPVSAWRSSGMTSKAYAAAQGLKAKTLLWWSSKLKGDGSVKQPVSFMEVVSLPSAAVLRATPTLRPRPRALELAPAFGAQTAQRDEVVLALEANPFRPAADIQPDGIQPDLAKRPDRAATSTTRSVERIRALGIEATIVLPTLRTSVAPAEASLVGAAPIRREVATSVPARGLRPRSKGPCADGARPTTCNRRLRNRIRYSLPGLGLLA